MSHVAGYTVAHNVSARDWQMKKNGKQWLLGKTFDTFCPLGPAIVTPSSLSGSHNYSAIATSCYCSCRMLTLVQEGGREDTVVILQSGLSTSDPHKLGIRCRLNGEVVQNSNTEQLVHKTEALIAFISRSTPS